MAPKPSHAYAGDSGGRDTVESTQLRHHTTLSASQSFTDCHNIGLRKNRPSVPLPELTAPLSRRVAHVLGVGPSEQMIRIDARRCVALVATEKPIERPMVRFIRKSMSAPISNLYGREFAVSVLVFRAKPKPTRTKFWSRDGSILVYKPIESFNRRLVSVARYRAKLGSSFQLAWFLENGLATDNAVNQNRSTHRTNLSLGHRPGRVAPSRGTSYLALSR